MIKNFKFYLVTLSAFTVCLTADIISKFFVDKYIMEGERINLLGSSFFQLIKLYNRGGVFGIMQGHQNLFMISSGVIFIVLVAYYFYEKSKTILFSLAMGMIFSGAIGNLIDRIIQKPGVVDFLYFGVEGVYKWPAFNVADSSVVAGAAILAYVFYQQEKQIKLINKENIEEK